MKIIIILVEGENMKRNRLLIFAIAVLLLISSISIWNNFTVYSKQEHIRKLMINHIYFELTNISSTLDDMLVKMDSQPTNDDMQKEKLIILVRDFIQLHTTFKYYSLSFGNLNTTYALVTDFEFIANTLTSQTGVVNSNAYSGILEDNEISENEYQYLTILKSDIDIMIKSMTSVQNPLQENQELTTIQINNMLNLFFDKWSWHKEDSPYFLLCH